MATFNHKVQDSNLQLTGEPDTSADAVKPEDAATIQARKDREAALTKERAEQLPLVRQAIEQIWKDADAAAPHSDEKKYGASQRGSEAVRGLVEQYR